MQSRQERFGEPLQARPISRHVAGRNKSESLRSIDHEHIFVGRYRASARLPFWFRAEASQKAKNLWRKRATVARYSMFYRFLCNVMQRASQKAKRYGVNAPQLRAIRCSIDFCVMLCNEMAFNPVQTWFSDFAAMCRSTTVGMASDNKWEDMA